MIRNSLPLQSYSTDVRPGTRSPERDLAADGLEDQARILRANGNRAKADHLDEKARLLRWALVRP